ncbi:hypothetical protein C5Y93_19955 [Blastopirellula marina]|uniref:Uncharacterized protein n=1 Tax=Blastopirellula marina TaxID=124 RepID=A0A2S8GIG4_9BACT|nr:hypothetical protein C5Y93_19955 [Blastopirellula marina]
MEQRLQAHPRASHDLREIVRWAISEAELSCEYGVSSEDLSDAAKLADAAHEMLQDLDDVMPAMTSAVCCWVAKAAQFPDRVAASAAYGASMAAQRYACRPSEVEADFLHLDQLCRDQQWTERSPVSASVFRPLKAANSQK